jgi:hypothetical protein
MELDAAAFVSQAMPEQLAQAPEEIEPAARTEVDAAALIGQATAELLAAIENWAAQVAKAEAANSALAIAPTTIDRPAESRFVNGSIAIAAAALDDVRGGFDDGKVRINFGIERAVYINGDLVTKTSFNVADLGRITGGGQPGAGGGDKPNMGAVLIQNGPGNVVQPGVAQNAAATVIQNTLNDQNIGSVTILNATVNSLQAIKGIDLQSALRSVVTQSVQR